MTRNKIISVAQSILNQMKKYRKWVPRDTGTMAFDALRFKVENNFIIIYVDTTIAPYVPYTNEPWLSAKWNGKQNPNEGWWDNFANEFIRRLALRLKGEIK